MSSNYEAIEAFRVDMAQHAQDVQMLFKKISESYEKIDMVVLSELGYKVCKKMRKNCEEFETFLDTIKSSVE